MSFIVVSPLDRIAEVAVRHGARDMVSLLSLTLKFLIILKSWKDLMVLTLTVRER